MRKRKMYVKVMAVMMAAVMLLTTVNLNAFLSAAGNATKDALTESGWDYAFEADLFGSSVSYLDEAFDVYQYQWTTDPSATGSKVGPVKPTATDPNSYNGSYSYFTTQYYGNASRGGLKPTSIQGGNNNGLTMLTYNKGIMKDFEAEYEFYAEAAMMGLTFGGEAGKFQITQDGNNSNDTAVALYMEGTGKLLVSGAIDTNNVTASGDARVETDVNASWYGWINNTANVVASGMTGKDTISVENDLTKNSKTFIVCIKVQDGVLSIYEKNHSDNVLNVNLSEQYQSGPVSLVHTNTNQGAFKSFGIRNNDQAEEKQWEDSFQAELFGASVSYLNDAFDVYQYQWTTDPAATGSKVGPVKPTATDPNSYQGNYSYFTTQYYGNASRGGLKPTRILDGGYTALTYKNSSYTDFEAEYEMLTAWGVFGLSFGGRKGQFPVSLDGNVSNDTGVMLFMDTDGCLSIGGAIAAGTAVCSDAGVTVTQGGQWNLRETNNIMTTSLAKGIEPVSNPGNNPETYTICVKVKNGTLTVWEKANPEKKVSVQLTEQYQGGYVSLIANQTQHGAFKAFHIRSLEHDMYYPVDFENLSDITELDDMFTAYHLENAYGAGKVDINYALYGENQVDLNSTFNSYYFENATAVAKKGNPTEQWTASKDLPDYYGYWQNWGLKPVHKNNGAQTLLTLKERLGNNFTATVQYNTSFVGYGIVVAPEGELVNGENGFLVNVNSDGGIHVEGAIDVSTAKWSGAGKVTQHAGSVTGPAQSGYISPVESWNDANGAYYDLIISVQNGKLTAKVKGYQNENFTGTLTVNLAGDYTGNSLSLWSTGYDQGCFWQLAVNGDKGSATGRPSEYWTRELHPDPNQIGTDVPYLKPNHEKDGSMTLLTYNKATTSDFRAKVEIANSWTSYGMFLAPAGQMLTASNGIGVYVDADGCIHVMGAVDYDSAKSSYGGGVWHAPAEELCGLTNGFWTDFQTLGTPSNVNTKDTVYTLCVSHVNGLLTIYLEQYPDNVVTVETTEDYRGGSLSLFSTGWNQGGFKSLTFDTFTEDEVTWEKGRQGEYVTFTLRTDIAYGSRSAGAVYPVEELEYVKAVTPNGVTADVWDTNGSLQLYLNSADTHYGEWITLMLQPKTDTGKAGSLSNLTMRVVSTQFAARTARIQQLFPGDVNNDYDVDVKDLVRLKKYAEDRTTEIHKENSRLNINTKIEESYNQKLMRKKLVK